MDVGACVGAGGAVGLLVLLVLVELVVANRIDTAAGGPVGEEVVVAMTLGSDSDSPTVTHW